MKLWRIRALLLWSVVTSWIACLDPEPITVTDTRLTQKATPACLQCLGTPGEQGCGDQFAACQAVPTCNAGLQCMVDRGCVGGTLQTYLDCAPECARFGGIVSSDDPGAVPAVGVFECMLLGPCRPLCFTDVEPGDAGNPITDAPAGGDTGDGGACANAADMAALANQTNVSDAAKTCGINCVNKDMSCIPTASSCMSMRAGLSSGCAQCWGEYIYCSIQHCFNECAVNQDAQMCTDCTSQMCGGAYRACSGQMM